MIKLCTGTKRTEKAQKGTLFLKEEQLCYILVLIWEHPR